MSLVPSQPSRRAALAILACLCASLAASAPADQATWWAFRPPARRAIPANAGHPIDYFIERKLAEKGLALSPPAAPRERARRLYLVMLGVTPSPETLDAFVADPRPDAWEQLVDRVLSDPRYGERWAQHWLDVIRWAETVGFETNAPRLNAWPYRDWVIRSLNQDKPYDRFVFEQIAGDTASEDAALGFLVAGPANLPGQIGRDEEAMRTARQDELDEVIRTVSQSLMGLTIGCARCHDHKFDPIAQRDYYALQAVFAGLRYGDRRWRGEQNDAWAARVPDAAERVAALERRLREQETALGLLPALQTRQEERFPPVVAAAVRMNLSATENGGPASLYEFEAWTDGAAPENVALAARGGRATASGFALANQTRHPDNLVDGGVDPRQDFPWQCDKAGPAWIQVDFPAPASIDRVVWQAGFSVPAEYEVAALTPDGAWQTVANTGRRALRLSDQRSATDIRRDGVSEADLAALVSLNAELRRAKREWARLKAGPQVFAARFVSKADPTYLLRRGDPMRRGDEVGPAVPAALGRLDLPANAPEKDRRLALARHLTRPDHPLTARVIVNRVWQRHFGVGIVRTSSDFGRAGQPPSHPALLDWLARRLADANWSLKSLHRLILTSATFQQSSRPRADALEVDADARFLWRFPPRRVEAEALRDSMLAASGKLNRKAGGAGFDFFREQGGLSDYHPHETFDEDGWRRMVYARKIRMQAAPIFGAFDCPDAGQMTPRRTRSITPLQALSLMNSPFANRQAAFFAERLRREAGGSPAEQVARGFQVALGRPPTRAELERMTQLAVEHGLKQVCRALFNASEFMTLP